jgi:MFS-type transporter involved in bile tolerance (Atg22 family)
MTFMILIEVQWEFYFYNVIFGLFQAPYYAVRLTTASSIPICVGTNVLTQYAQTMISELMPPGYDNMFFALFGITNRAVSHLKLSSCSGVANER